MAEDEGVLKIISQDEVFDEKDSQFEVEGRNVVVDEAPNSDAVKEQVKEQAPYKSAMVNEQIKSSTARKIIHDVVTDIVKDPCPSSHSACGVYTYLFIRLTTNK